MDLAAERPEPLPIRPHERPAPLTAAADLAGQIENAFQYHAPKGDQQKRYERLREQAKTLAYLINSSCPHSRERALAITNLENCVMWANASIARNE